MAALDAGARSPDYQSAEALILSHSQAESFPLGFKALKVGKPVPSSSQLSTLAPEFDEVLSLIRVGGQLRRLEGSSLIKIHPVVLDPRHSVTKLLIQDVDGCLQGRTELLLSCCSRYYWILSGRQAVKKHQRGCVQCQRWKAKLMVPIMADLPLARL